MRTEQRTVYIAEDGSEFDSDEPCIKRDKLVKLDTVVNDYASYDLCSSEVAELILEKWEEIQRIVND